MIRFPNGKLVDFRLQNGEFDVASGCMKPGMRYCYQIIKITGFIAVFHTYYAMHQYNEASLVVRRIRSLILLSTHYPHLKLSIPLI